MQLLRDLVLIKADEAKTMTDSGFHLRENWKSLPNTGEILAIGPDVKTVKVGDKIGFFRYGSIILGNNELLCKERHILWVES